VNAPTSPAAVLSSVLSPAPTAPSGGVNWLDVARVVFSAAVKSGGVALILSAVGAAPGIPASAVAVVSLLSTLLRVFSTGPAR
jgi:hypothetical protein